MSFFGKLLTGAVKVALTPVAVVADVVKAADGETPDTTIGLVESAANDIIDGAHDLTQGDII